MKLKLSKGEADVKVFFDKAPDGRRTTVLRMLMTWSNGTQSGLSSSVACSGKDQFCRRVGRRLVLQKFLHEWDHDGKDWSNRHRIVPRRHVARARSEYTPLQGCYMGGVYVGGDRALTRDDRRLLWEAVCPEFRRKGASASKPEVVAS